MGLDRNHYNRDVIIEGEHFYTKTQQVNEVIRGNKEPLHSEALIPKFDKMFPPVLSLQATDLIIRNTSDFSSGDHASTTKAVRGKCSLAPTCGRGFSFFGNALLVQDIKLFVYSSEQQNNHVMITPKLGYRSHDHDKHSNASLQIAICLSPSHFKDFYDQAANNPSNLGAEIHIELVDDCGIYEQWDPTGEYSFDYVLKILTKPVLIASKLEENVLPTIEGKIFDKFRLSWVDTSKMERHEEDQIDPWSIEYIQSTGSQRQVDELVNRDRPSWFSRNWIWFALAIAALVGFAR